MYLMSLISSDKVNASEYSNLCRTMHDIEFIVFNPMDENRVGHAEKMRDNWLDSLNVKDERLKIEYAKDICDRPVSFFEIIVSLCVSANDILADPNKPDFVSEFFWQLMDNMVQYGSYGSKYTKANEVLSDDMWNSFTENTTIANVKRIVTRTYHADGVGGLFPLKNPHINQRKEEMWTCCIAYINENYINI